MNNCSPYFFALNYYNATPEIHQEVIMIIVKDIKSGVKVAVLTDKEEDIQRTFK